MNSRKTIDEYSDKNKQRYKSSKLISFLIILLSFLFLGIVLPNYNLTGDENIDKANNISIAMCFGIGCLFSYVISGACKNRKIGIWQIFVSALFGLAVFFLMIPVYFAIGSLLMIFF